ncbi:ABC transporter substrate-binding protein [Maridesulfovibrio salexigens]|uniref:Substrate-binding region of ABC-type glycine betaine transport system n=1 Tax=Maridesulfovibrio salexigens (strain ATCC 14822 / DSM 2638 / NCIMB 8403 / VKM B-1763) TaxID=526222 RepID=C6BZ59_MARSD|nr:ABC transporter substrate-binding protein [Maridesulfovibrio salexigens]ACS78883.1 Substrate-binding region of ABC-type glycine betaine transport system [Maridesulfovibrio salexigens DSM 2638]
MNTIKSHAMLWVAGFVFAAIISIMPVNSAQAADKPVIFADLNWDSIQIHNRIAGFIIEHGYGTEVEYIPAGTAIAYEAIMRDDMDVDMESWTSNSQHLYDKGIKAGTLFDLGPNFKDAREGLMVPTYMIKGDPKRGIKPMTPDLKTVADLAKYPEYFKDPEDPSMGLIYSGVTGWTATQKTEQKLKNYGLDDNFNFLAPGSDAALAGSMVSAYKRGKGWVGYYWGPTWVMGMIDMTFLEEAPYDPKVWNDTRLCLYPNSDVNIIVGKSLMERAPEIIEMFKKYETTMAMTNECLAYMKNENASLEEVAEWFLKTKEDVWTKWVSADRAAKIKAALN